ncbi:serine/threonine-protein kinase [Reyranella soli]|uniref:Protein kinase n=1 Tax=Reyranella soli TaxID=1230389 RepID=A0A512NFX4_9HYPH|nr:serine/threonine-protein kinase [Reyranella soli]GEP57846.1 protein kinase [Reyranella soli]
MKGPHKKNEIVSGRYRIDGFLGEGGMQFVYRAHDLMLDRRVALKTPKNASAEKRFHRSAIVAAKVNHPNVAKTLDYLDVGDRAYLVEEYVSGSDLGQALLGHAHYIDPYLAARVFHHLVKGLAASHHVGVVHRDLKPSNVMVGGGFQLRAIKITDFGIAKLADEELTQAAEGGSDSITSSRTAVGALPYMAPEAIETPRKVALSADIWSIGAMMYELVSGKPPYGTGLKAVRAILEAKPPEFPSFVTSNAQFAPLSNSLSDLILKCLAKDAQKRPTADQLVGQCSQLYYPMVERHVGTIRTIRHNAWGFIAVDGTDVFFNFDSVYGARPGLNDRVMLSKFPGGGAHRAHPVVKLR